MMFHWTKRSCDCFTEVSKVMWVWISALVDVYLSNIMWLMILINTCIIAIGLCSLFVAVSCTHNQCKSRNRPVVTFVDMIWNYLGTLDRFPDSRRIRYWLATHHEFNSKGARWQTTWCKHLQLFYRSESNYHYSSIQVHKRHRCELKQSLITKGLCSAGTAVSH